MHFDDPTWLGFGEAPVSRVRSDFYFLFLRFIYNIKINYFHSFIHHCQFVTVLRDREPPLAPGQNSERRDLDQTAPIKDDRVVSSLRACRVASEL